MHDHKPTRAQRRFHAQRLKTKARRLYPEDPKAKNANHLTACSCAMCGNGRKHFGYGTFAEERAKTAWNEAVQDAVHGT